MRKTIMKYLILLVSMAFTFSGSFAQRKTIDDPIYSESSSSKISSTSSRGQISLTPITLGLHMSKFNTETKNSPSTGFGFSLSFNRFYMDLASNFSSGKGEPLKFSSEHSYAANKCNVGVFNVGYIIPIRRFSIIPYLGYGYSNEIFQDPVGWDTYYLGETKSDISVGLIGSIKIANHLRFQAGVGTFETFKVGLTYCSD
jgi:hypothetical protein